MLLIKMMYGLGGMVFYQNFVVEELESRVF